MCAIPILETERLRLRAHRLEDFEPFAAMWADPLVVRYISGKPSSQQESWARFLRDIGHWSLMGFGYWVLEEKATGLFIGDLGFADSKRDGDLPIRNMPEIGWVLSPRAHGKGYATEAAKAAVAWGDKHFGTAQTVCLIDPQNKASIRVAEKCGYRELVRTRYRDEPTIVFRR